MGSLYFAANLQNLVFCGVRVAWSLIFCVVFSRSLLALLTFFFWPLISSKNASENRRGNHEWTIQRNWHYWVHKTQDEDKQNNKPIKKTFKKKWATAKCWTSLYANIDKKHNKTCAILQTLLYTSPIYEYLPMLYLNIYIILDKTCQVYVFVKCLLRGIQGQNNIRLLPCKHYRISICILHRLKVYIWKRFKKN